MSFKVYIPARYASSRLPGKLLKQVGDKPLLAWAYQNALQSGADEVVIATDHELIEKAAVGWGAKVVMTDPSLQSGSDRIAEATKLNQESPDQLIVNLQGDEPLLPAAVIKQVAELGGDEALDIATIYEKFASVEEAQDPNVCKVVPDASGRALYFSRAQIPFQRDESDQGPLLKALRRHVGIYAYSVGFLRRYVELPQSDLEKLESLEQLRALENGYSIGLQKATEPCGFGIDTQADYERLCAMTD
ncbi:MAG: 3-deoxy-manno-octulosonate cytidylyltransferase [Pseudomonadota bacterium]